MTVSLEQIKELRDRSGLSIGRCKQALEASGGDLDQALTLLQSEGTAIAAKKSGRGLGAGVIGAYVHSDGALGALVELACETDFVAKNQEFKTLADDLAMHVAAFMPADLPSLLAQPFVKDQSLTVDTVIKNYLQKFGERLELIRFNRLAVGEN